MYSRRYYSFFVFVSNLLQNNLNIYYPIILAVCMEQRRRVLHDLPTNDVVGVHIPRCDLTGKYYRAVQCRTATDECWCVSEFGQIIGWLKPKTVDCDGVCETLRSTMKHVIEEKHEHAETRRRKQEILTSSKQDGQMAVILSKDANVKQQPEPIIVLRLKKKCLWTKAGQCPIQPKSLTATSKFCHCDSDCPDIQKCCSVLTGVWACSTNIIQNNGWYTKSYHSFLF